jgi:cytochrome b6-f complex iron-sulfur subunit
MERDEFIKNLGLGLIAVCGASTLAACSNKTTPNPNSNGDKTVTVDLAAKLKNVGDQVVTGSILVFRIAAGNAPASFVATEAICPHQSGNLNWINSQSLILCDLHAAQYKNTGAIIRGPQNSSGVTRALKIYSTAVNGTNLVVTVA